MKAKSVKNTKKAGKSIDTLRCAKCGMIKWACDCSRTLSINNTHLEVLENLFKKGHNLQDALDIVGIKYITYNHFETRFPEVREKRLLLQRDRKRIFREKAMDTMELAVATDPKYALEYLKNDKDLGFVDEKQQDTGNKITVNLMGDYTLSTDGKVLNVASENKNEALPIEISAIDAEFGPLEVNKEEDGE